MTVSPTSFHVRKLLVLVTALFVSLLLANVFFVRNAFAATGNMYVSPASSSVEKNKTLTVNVRINPGTNVDTVHVVVGYNASMLTYTGLSFGGSPFDKQIGPPVVDGGTVTFDQFNVTDPVSSDSFIASLTFTANVGTGSSTISLTGSDAVFAGTSTGPSKKSGSVSFASPPAVTPITPSPPSVTRPTKPGTGSTAAPSAPSATGTTKTPVAQTPATPSTTGTTSTPAPGATPVTVKQADVSYNHAKIVASSAQPTKVYVQLSVNGQLISNTPETGFATEHVVDIDESMLMPGTQYSYVVVATNQQGVKSQSEASTFRTKGMAVSVRVLNIAGKPLRDKKVTLHSDPQTVTTDENGNAVFKDVAPGQHSLQYTADGKKYTKDIVVLNNIQLVGDTQTASQQNFAVTLDVEEEWGMIVPTMIVVLALAAAGVCAYLYNMKKRGAAFSTVSSLTAPVVVMGGNTPTLSKVSLVSPDGSSQPITPSRKVPEPGTIISVQNDPNDSSDNNQTLESK